MRLRVITLLVSITAIALMAMSGPVAAQGLVELHSVQWQLVNGNVEFLLMFHNTDLAETSGAVSGEIWAQQFGMFLPNISQIGTFDVPALLPDVFFEVDVVVSAASLPPSADIISPDGNGNLVIGEISQLACTNTQWAGNVDIFWAGPGGSGQVQAHVGLIPVCAGAGNSYIHVLMDCQDPAGIFWSFNNVCPGWAASLVVDNGGLPGAPAPNPIPAGMFDGWICVSAQAGTPIGTQCSFSLTGTCGSLPATINLTAEVCSWLPVGTEELNWGPLKQKYNSEDTEEE